MKTRILSFFLAFLMIFTITGPSFAETEEKELEEVRDQDLLVPTSRGIQQATKKEFDEVKQLEMLSNNELMKNYLIGDYKSGKILAASNIDQVVGIASITKLMTVYIVLDDITAGRLRWEDRVVPDEECTRISGSSYKLKQEESYTVKQLVTAAMVVSGNDASIALAKHISGSQENFVQRMNQKAKELGLTHAHFVNVHGLTDYGLNDYNKMTPRELFFMTTRLLQDHEIILELSVIPYISEIERPFLGYNTNPLLGIVKGIDGLKTGYTNAAGHCLVATGFTPGDKNHGDTRLIGIFMGSEDSMKRFVGSKRLMEEAMDRYRYTQIGNPGKAVEKIKLKRGVPEEIEVYPKEGKTLMIDGKQPLKTELLLDPIEVPTKKGSEIGTVVYSIDEEIIYKTPAIIHEDIREPNIIIQFQQTLEDVFVKMEKAV